MSDLGRPLDDTVTVSVQIHPDDVAAIARSGVKLIVNNRPDHEEPGQPTSAQIEAAATAAGLAYRHIPVTSATIGPVAVGAFADAIEAADGKVFAFCRSGTRCTVLWALATARAGSATPEVIVGTAASQGYDIANLRPTLERLAEGEG